MESFQRNGKLFSSIGQSTESISRGDSKTTKISSMTEDKTKTQIQMHSTYLTSQVQTLKHQVKQQTIEGERSLKIPLAVRDENRPNYHKTKFELARFAPSKSDNEPVFKETPRSSVIEHTDLLENSSLLPKHSQQIRKNHLHLNKHLHTNQVKSIIFDSKAQKIDGFDSKSLSSIIKSCIFPNENNLKIFKSKVVKVNMQIDAKLANLQRMIEQVRHKKQQKKQEKQSNAISQQKNLCESKLYQDANIINRQLPPLQQANEIEMSPSASKVQLKGSFQSKQAALSLEYTTFINRLSSQIQIDMEFTQKTSELARNNNLSAIKTIIVNRVGTKNSINLSFFEIDSAEMDPLQKKSSSLVQMTQAEMQAEAVRLYQRYQEIQGHFESKLQHAFSPSIISLLFDELSSRVNGKQNDGITVGDLLSYLNMRTNTSFRNRFFVKMMKRLGLKGNGCIPKAVLQKFTTNELNL